MRAIDCSTRNFMLFAKKRRTIIGQGNQDKINKVESLQEKKKIVLPDTLIVKREGNIEGILETSHACMIISKYYAYSFAYRFISTAYSEISGVVPIATISSELREFQRTTTVQNSSDDINEDGGDNSITEKFKDFIGTVLIADFFLIIFFLLWFVTAAVLQSSYPVVLERFQDIFQPVVVPSLTLLMVGSIASGTLGKKRTADS